MSIENEIIAAVQAEKNRINDKAVSRSDSLAFAASITAFFNPPLALSLIGLAASAHITDSILAGKDLKKTKMPDKWLKKVSESQAVSDEGLKFLSKRVKNGGSVTVSDAIKFLEIESPKEKPAKVTLEYSAGAQALLDRAKTDLPSLIDFRLVSDKIDSVFNWIKK